MGSSYFLKFLSYNVEGLPSKINNNEFLSHINKYDFVTLVETWMPDGETLNIPGFYSFSKGRPKHRKAKRFSAGISVLVKKSLRKGVKFFSSASSKFVWWKLENSLFNLKKDIYVCSVYIPPQNSKYSKDNGENCPYVEIQKDILKFKKLGDIILMGDFNARKGNLQDQTELNSVFTNLENTEGDFLVGHKFPNMRSMDTKTNKFGRSLVEILSANSLICLNGRTKGDPLGNFTCFTPKGNSAVDYIILNDDLFNDAVYFKVNPLSYLSGHCPISFALKSGSFCGYTNEDSFLKEKPNSFTWDVSSRQKFSKIAGSDDVVTSAMKIIHLHMNSLNQNTQSKVNIVVNSVTEIIKDMASRCFKRRQIKPKRQNKHLSVMNNQISGLTRPLRK